MDKTYNHKSTEERVYQIWEKSGAFIPKIDPAKKPFTILLPLPNANNPMHMGHVMFVIQDILVRFHRMKGDPTLWLPGGDHAGIETQYVFERKLAKEGKSRFDFDRNTLYRMISDFVEENKDVNRNQMKRLGFSLDWTRYHYSLEPEIVNIVIETFKKLYTDKLIYRDEQLVQYCTKCGTSFSELEIKHIEKQDPLYYMKYGPFVLATVRPETKFGDTAVAVNPKDKRYKKWVGKEIEVTGLNGNFRVMVIADREIDPAFGTGVAKVTPAHDMKDFEIGKRHHLEMKQVIGFDGRLTALAGPYAGLKVKAAREKVAADLESRGLMDHVDKKYTHTVATCYKCGTVLEPLPIPQWYVKTKPLAKPAIAAVKKGLTKIAPLPRFKKMYFEWLKNIHDWNISRQIVWGPRIPVWYCLDCNPQIMLSFINKSNEKVTGTYEELCHKYSFAEINAGLQTLMAPLGATYSLEKTSCFICGGNNILQETDTFDTWFLSGQWPMTTLGFPDSVDFEYFYPTSVLDTMWDILFFWVARMMMLGLYRTGKAPFEVIHLHSRVVDKFGQKMSKSKGNVVNPIEMVEEYGADALRFALVYGSGPGSDIVLSEEKIRGMRNFANKLWNIGRFINLQLMTHNLQQISFYQDSTQARKKLHQDDQRILSDLTHLIVKVTKSIETYRFNETVESLYEFTWHTFADKYIEAIKPRLNSGNTEKIVEILSVLRHVYIHLLKLLHPFMPFVTEEIWGKLPRKKTDLLIVSSWPGKKIKL